MKQVPLSEAKAHLAGLLARVEDLGEPLVITRSGHPAGVLVSVDEYEGLLETLEILSDPRLMKRIRSGLKDLREGRVVGQDEVWG
ncbi:type II toxin-antitoxin system Phd/YefM family antitoxin [Acidobacteria bacterium ACD]|nr:MAG: type II toxin-antitoxin system Phd/YefM family antitoxin [Acidobacteriota bacterium]MCE7956620.1 type II toxin-antitoxin system Phd/YefM family antitoxin [Acidobacteria bacterium ACB2]MDL1948392.1 type II toxin-antitoxin system Phd/YefM family antitoxin [Acidobacteria bacterium ACD]